MTVLNEFTFLNGVTAPCYSKELLNNAGGGLVLAVSDGFDGSITVQGKQNGEWYTLGVVDLAKAGAADAITAAGSYSVIGVAGFSHIRLNLTAVSGTATVSGRLTTEPGTILAASSSESGGGGGSGLPVLDLYVAFNDANLNIGNFTSESGANVTNIIVPLVALYTDKERTHQLASYSVPVNSIIRLNMLQTEGDISYIANIYYLLDIESGGQNNEYISSARYTSVTYTSESLTTVKMSFLLISADLYGN